MKACRLIEYEKYNQWKPLNEERDYETNICSAGGFVREEAEEL